MQMGSGISGSEYRGVGLVRALVCWFGGNRRRQP